MSSEVLRVITVAPLAKYTDCNSAITVAINHIYEVIKTSMTVVILDVFAS